jgi:hypothetical protein
MGFMSVAVNGENDRKRAEAEKGRKSGTTSVTENYLENNPTTSTQVSPDSPAAVPGLFAPRNIIGRN